GVDMRELPIVLKLKEELAALQQEMSQELPKRLEEARAHGHDTVINVRIETSPLARARSDAKGTAGVEIMAFGTAVTLRAGTRKRIGPGGGVPV
ncbi:MAG: hypothetical protein ACPHQP_09570, partial [Longimicrobiales bacterium]